MEETGKVIWKGRTAKKRLFLQCLIFILLGIIGLKLHWILAAFFGAIFLALVAISYTRLTLTTEALKIQKILLCLEFDLHTVQKIRIRQGFLDRLCDSGELLITLKKEEGSFRIRGLLRPYEGWKQIKIALFQCHKTSPDHTPKGILTN